MNCTSLSCDQTKHAATHSSPKWSLTQLFQLVVPCNEGTGYSGFVTRVRQASTLTDIVGLMDAPPARTAAAQRLLEDRTDLLLKEHLQRLLSITDVHDFLRTSSEILSAWRQWRARLPFNAHLAENQISTMAQLRFSISLPPLLLNN